MNIEVNISEDSPIEEALYQVHALENEEQRQFLIDCIERFGSAVSVTIFDPAFKIFRAANIDGLIGYRVECGCAIAFGDPVAAEKDMGALALSFQKYCEIQGLKMVFAITSEKFARWAMDHICQTLIEFGESLICNPMDSQLAGSKGRELRKKMYQSTREGLIVYEYLSHNEKIEKAIIGVASSWLNARKGPQIYLAELNLFQDRKGKRWFYAVDNDKIVGVLILNRLEAREGWLFHLLMATPDARQGTTELLAVSALETLRKEGCSFASLSIMPGAEIGEIIGLGKISTWVTRKVFHISKRVFHLDKRKRYWKKFNPQVERSFFLFNEEGLGLREILGIMRSLNVSIY